METYELYSLLAKVCWLLFVVATGCCVGSLINVLAYRLPRGFGVVTPPSRCPACQTRLTWRENIPVLGWIILRGRCRYCRSPISPEYPIVEAFTGALFGLFFTLWYLVPPDYALLGINIGAVRPEWTLNDPFYTWPAFAVLLFLLGSLTAMTLIDARTFTIPLVLPWAATAVALVVHPLHAFWVEHTIGQFAHTAPGAVWTMAIPGWWGIGAGIGAAAGIGISASLVHAGIIRRSFEDYEDWEQQAIAEAEARSAEQAGESSQEPVPSDQQHATGGEQPGGAAANPAPDSPEMWIQYPHARREMFREMAFLAPPVCLALIGGWVAVQVGDAPPPLWLKVLGGVMVGYLAGAGVVWAVRILGSLAFGKEAMGLGDVHLMGAVGAALGWIDAVLAFFGAAFVGIAWLLLRLCLGGRAASTLPYGPYLAVSTALVLLTKPLVERGLTRLLQIPPEMPPISIP